MKGFLPRGVRLSAMVKVSCVDNTTSQVTTYPTVTGSAYVAADAISFFPAVLHRKLRITITFIPGLTLHGGDRITVRSRGAGCCC